MADIISHNDLVHRFEQDPDIVTELSTSQLCMLLCIVGEHELIVNTLADRTREGTDGRDS